jgi:hypothetical protein
MVHILYARFELELMDEVGNNILPCLLKQHTVLKISGYLFSELLLYYVREAVGYLIPS